MHTTEHAEAPSPPISPIGSLSADDLTANLIVPGQKDPSPLGTFPFAAAAAVPVDMTPLTVRSVGGPDSGWSRDLPEGRHWIGRAPTADLRLADPAVEPHHALLDVDPFTVRVFHVAGRHPLVVECAESRSVDGWVTVAPDAAVTIGHSRLRIGRPGHGARAAAHCPHVVVPLDDSGDEYARFECDLRSAVDAELTARRSDPSAILLGEGSASIHVELRTRDGDGIEAGRLDYRAQRLVERVTRPVATISTSRQVVVGESCLAVVAPDPEPVADAIAIQLPSDERHRARIVVLEPGADPPDECTALLDVGTTWQATWQPELRRRPDRLVRLHARGRARVGGQPSIGNPAGRSSLSR